MAAYHSDEFNVRGKLIAVFCILSWRVFWLASSRGKLTSSSRVKTTHHPENRLRVVKLQAVGDMFTTVGDSLMAKLACKNRGQWGEIEAGSALQADGH